MAIMINTSELKETLELTPSTQNVMLVGKHGIGKSEILTSFFNSKGMKVVTLFLGQMADPGDIIGIPSKVEKQDADGNVSSQTDFTPPYWFSNFQIHLPSLKPFYSAVAVGFCSLTHVILVIIFFGGIERACRGNFGYHVIAFLLQQFYHAKRNLLLLGRRVKNF